MEENEIKIRLGMKTHTCGPIHGKVGGRVWAPAPSSILGYMELRLKKKKKDKIEKVSYFPTILASQNMNHFS